MDGLPYVFVDLVQGSPAWHEWRSHGIGASEAPTIMGENSWRSADQLLQSRLGIKEKRSATGAMARGTALEPEARREYCKTIGDIVIPVCLQSLEFDWLRASLDGMNFDGSRVVEIKCGRYVYREAACFRRVPRNYFGQIQHILAVTGLPEIDFWCYWPHCAPVHLRVARDDQYIRRLLKIEERFWTLILDGRSRAESIDLVPQAMSECDGGIEYHGVR